MRLYLYIVTVVFIWLNQRKFNCFVATSEFSIWSYEGTIYKDKTYKTTRSMMMTPNLLVRSDNLNDIGQLEDLHLSTLADVKCQ